MLFVAIVAAAAAVDVGTWSPGLIPSSNVTDFLCSEPCLPTELTPAGAAAAERDAPEIDS